MAEERSGGRQGLGGAVYLGRDQLKIVSGGADGRLCIRDEQGGHQEDIPRIDNSSINCVAAHAATQRFATTDNSKAVHVYEFPFNKSTLAARLQLPGFLLSFNASGERLVAGSNDEMLHIISIRADTEANSLKAQVIRKLKAVPQSRGLAFDSEGEFVAALSASGLLQVWEAVEGKQVLSRKHTGPEIAQEKDLLLGLCWSPDGNDLAVACSNNEIGIFTRESWAYRQTLSGEHASHVCCLSYSQNGVYLASSGRDNKVNIWAAADGVVTASRSFEAQVCSVNWKPDANELLCMTLSGEVLLWKDVIPDGRLKPFEDAPTRSVEAPPFACAEPSVDEGDGSEEAHSRGIDTSDGPTGEGEARAGKPMDGFDAIMREAGGWDGQRDVDADDSAHRPGLYDNGQALHGQASHEAVIQRPELQEAFQPGSTSPGEDGRRWLAYDLTGGISLKEDEGIAILETIFHDTVANSRRIAPLRDYHAFTMASLSEKGAVFARKGNAREEARFMWRPHNPLYPNSDWTSNLPLGIRIDAVTAGRSFIAVATSDRHIHIFTTAGLQIGLQTLSGPVVALAARGNSLAAVWHGGWDFAHDNASLEFAVLDVNYKTRLCFGRLPLTQNSELAWLGFSQEGLLASWDTEGCLRIRTEDFGGSWVPVVSAGSHDKEPEEVWPIAVTKADLFYIACSPDAPPTVLPRPCLTKLPIQPAVLGGDEGPTAGLESEWMRLGSHLALIRARQEEENSEDIAESLMAEEIEEQTNADRVLLKLFQDALKTGRLQRAQELAACLHLQRSLQGALKLTNLHRVPILAERLSRLLASREEEAVQQEAPALFSTPQPPSVALNSVAGPMLGQQSTPRTQATPDESVQNEVDLEVEESENAGQDINSGTKSIGVASSLAPVVNPAARAKAGPLKELPRNTLFGSKGLDDSAGKRKAAGNPFARRAKVQK